MAGEAEIRTETKPSLTEENRQSINILKDLQGVASFGVAKGKVITNYLSEDGLKPTGRNYSVEDFLTAADFLCKNRCTDVMLLLATAKGKEGRISVYAPEDKLRKDDTRPVVEIEVKKMIEILELAFQLERAKKEPQSE